MKTLKPILIFVLLFKASWLFAIPTTVGLLEHSAGSTDNGYVLFAPMSSTTAYLIDKCGYVVNQWPGEYFPGLSVSLLPNGKLLRTGLDKASTFNNGGGGGYIEIMNWDGSIEWRYKLSTETECQHHDVKYLPNGNILAIVYDKKTEEEIQNAGRNPELAYKELWSEIIRELRPIGKDSAEIVWEWKLWDHLIQDFDSTRKNYGKVEQHIELIDLNFGAYSYAVDWQHLNAIDYNEELDQILLSSFNSSEIWIIDHSTTTAEAASHSGGRYGKGGDLLYRWGNPIAYRGGTVEDQKLYTQHDASWIPAGCPYEGNIMVFNNGNGVLNRRYSSVDIIKTPVDSNGFYSSNLPFSPESCDWSYFQQNPKDFYAVILSSAQMLKNGNVLICDGPSGCFFEIDSSKNIVWKYINPVINNGILKQGTIPMLTNNTFRCRFYYDDFEGFIGKDLSQKGLIENVNELSELCAQSIGILENENDSQIAMYPNPANNVLNIETDWNDFIVEIYDAQGVKRITNENIRYINTSTLENGVYYVKIMNKQLISNKNDTFIIWR